MKKFLAVVKREYVQRVRAKMFIVTTILLPMAMAFFAVVPILVVNIKTPPVRVAVVDQTGKLYNQLRQAIGTDEPEKEAEDEGARGPRPSGRRSFASFDLQEINAPNQSTDQLRTALNQRLSRR